MMMKDSVSWSRTTPNAVDALGNIVGAAATGFPRTVRGDWQPTSGSTVMNPEGQKIKIDATFFVNGGEFDTGRTGDTVTFSGQTFVCVGFVKHLRINTSDTDHIEYYFALSGIGTTTP